MEDVKWLIRKCGLPLLVLLLTVIAGVIFWSRWHGGNKKMAEEVWEPPVEIQSSETVATKEPEPEPETTTESAYWFIPQAGECLISDEEMEQLKNNVLVAAEQVSEIYKQEKILTGQILRQSCMSES